MSLGPPEQLLHDFGFRAVPAMDVQEDGGPEQAEQLGVERTWLRGERRLGGHPLIEPRRPGRVGCRRRDSPGGAARLRCRRERGFRLEPTPALRPDVLVPAVEPLEDRVGLRQRVGSACQGLPQPGEDFGSERFGPGLEQCEQGPALVLVVGVLVLSQVRPSLATGSGRAAGQANRLGQGDAIGGDELLHQAAEDVEGGRTGGFDQGQPTRGRDPAARPGSSPDQVGRQANHLRVVVLQQGQPFLERKDGEDRGRVASNRANCPASDRPAAALDEEVDEGSRVRRPDRLVAWGRLQLSQEASPGHLPSPIIGGPEPG